jgi:hypothetical protein
MSGSLRGFFVGLASLLAVAPLYGQRSVTIRIPKPTGPQLAALQQDARNLLGQARSFIQRNTPPGFQPFAPSLVPPLSAVPNPYLGGGSVLSTSPYAGDYSGYGYGYYIPPFAAALQGYASLTTATGDYWKKIQEARITREQSRQMALDTARKEIEFQRWLRATQLTGPQMRQREMTTDLERARRDPPQSEVWSGKPLNDLFYSLKTQPLNSASSPSLEKETLDHINLTDGNSRGNVGMLRNGGDLSWPDSLKEPIFDKVRKSFQRNLRLAVAQLKDKEPVADATKKDLNADFKELNKILDNSADDLTPAQYIEAKRYLNQLGAAVRLLSDANAIKYFDNTWVAKGKNVAELVAHMIKEGLTFAPATPGDEAAYNALFVALRSFEASMRSLSTQK